MSDLNKDIDGKTSSKRVWAGRLLWVGLGMATVWFGIYIRLLLRGEVLSMEFPYEMWFGIMGSGLGALGLVLGERYTSKKS